MKHVTRGFGFLEHFLAKKRLQKANNIISPESRNGRILDIGCGWYPLFLTTTTFREKYGIDQHEPNENYADIIFIRQNIEKNPIIPFSGNFFTTITMLAVFEHIEIGALKKTLKEIYRTLNDGGDFVLTTPSRWTEPILFTMSACKLISSEEIHEHKNTYTTKEIITLLEEAGFASGLISSGTFEAGMNIWIRARKKARTPSGSNNI